jgi:hypothetical protein
MERIMIHQEWFLDEFTLELKKETTMSDFYTRSDYRNELRRATVNPLLSTEKKLIPWSLGLGLLLLIVLAALNHVYSVMP